MAPVIFIKSLFASNEEAVLLEHMCCEQYGVIFDHPFNAIAAIFNIPEVILYETQSQKSRLSKPYAINQLNVMSPFDIIHKLFQSGGHTAIIDDQTVTEFDDSLTKRGALNQIFLKSLPIEELVFGIKFPKNIIIIDNKELYDKYQTLIPIIDEMRSSQLYGNLLSLNVFYVQIPEQVIPIIQRQELQLHHLQLDQISDILHNTPLTPPNSNALTAATQGSIPETLSLSDSIIKTQDAETQTDETDLIWNLSPSWNERDANIDAEYQQFLDRWDKGVGAMFDAYNAEHIRPNRHKATKNYSTFLSPFSLEAPMDKAEEFGYPAHNVEYLSLPLDDSILPLPEQPETTINKENTENNGTKRRKSNPTLPTILLLLLTLAISIMGCCFYCKDKIRDIGDHENERVHQIDLEEAENTNPYFYKRSDGSDTIKIDLHEYEVKTEAIKKLKICFDELSTMESSQQTDDISTSTF